LVAQKGHVWINRKARRVAKGKLKTDGKSGVVIRKMPAGSPKFVKPKDGVEFE
jgi:hypothetical protein